MAQSDIGRKREPPAVQTPLKSVAMPTEHGGWSLTLEPALLGLIVVPSVAGVALALAALLGFIVRTPMKVALVDQFRGRRLKRTILAQRVLAAELVLLVAIVAVAFVTSEAAFWWPFVIAAPLVAVELWYDMRSRSRRLLPELLGAIGIGSVSAAIVLAGGGSSEVAAGVWCVIAARSIATIPFVRTQLRRVKGQAFSLWFSDVAQILALVLVGVWWLLGDVPALGVIAIGVLGTVQVVLARISVPPVPVVGAQQVALGLMVVIVTGVGARVG